MRRSHLAVLAAAVLAVTPRATPGTGSAAAQAPFPAAAIDSVFADYDRADAPGCAVGVIRDGELVFAKGYGQANLEYGIPISPRSVFRIGSTSKQFAAAALVLLAQEGVVSLDDPVRRYIPEIPDYGPELTIRRLLTHTSGIRDYLELMDLAGLREDDYYTDADVVAMLARQPATNFEPGSEYLYSNSGYFLLSQIVLRTTGISLAEFARTRIFEPLGMAHTHFHDDHTRVVPLRATGYAPDADAPGGWRISTTTLPMTGDGGVFTTLEDLARWDRNFDEPVVGGPGFVPTLLQRGVLTSGDTLDYALGLRTGTQRGLRTVSHGGAFVGYRAHSLRYPDHATSLYALCNRADGEPSRIFAVGEALLGHLMEPVRAADGERAAPDPVGADTLDATPAELEAFAGTYRSDELDAAYLLRVDGGALRLEVGNWLDGPMARIGADTFRRRYLELRFARAEDGGVDGFTLDAGRVRGIVFRRTGG